MMSASCCPVVMCENPDCLQLTDREAQVCTAICSSPEPVSFSALRERVGYHQEVVSRILRRLVNHGAIEKISGRYRRASQ